MNLGDSIRSGTKWLMFGKVGMRLLEFAFGIIMARLLVPADFGMLVTISIFTGFVGMFVAGGMGQSLIRSKAVDSSDFTAVFTLQLAIGVLVYLGFYVTAPFIANFFSEPLYTDLIRVSTLTFLLRPFLSMRNAWLNRQMNFKSRSIVDVVTGLFSGVASVSMALLGMGIWSLVLSGLFGSLLSNILLARLTPLELRLNPNASIMRKHSTYGFKIVANDFVTYLRRESRNLILSKMAGPALLGLFNKADSLSRLPNQLMMSPVMEPLFRAMSKMQDDLDKTQYMYYRTITLLMAYTTPVYVLLWWIAEPFISIVYGEKWVEAGAPMSILATAGIFLNVIFPSSVVLTAQNRLGQEMLAQTLNLAIIIGAVIFGLNWGLEGIAWAIVISQGMLSFHFYLLVQRTLQSRVRDLLYAVLPGLSLSAMLFLVLLILDLVLGARQATSPLLYLLVMSIIGGLVYWTALLVVPIHALRTEAARWRQKLHGLLARARR